jgi:hypothetical protein
MREKTNQCFSMIRKYFGIREENERENKTPMLLNDKEVFRNSRRRGDSL